MAYVALTEAVTVEIASVAFAVSEETPVIVTYSTEGSSETSAQVAMVGGAPAYPSVQFYFRCRNSGGTVLLSSAIGVPVNYLSGDGSKSTIVALRAVTQKLSAPANTATVTLEFDASSSYYHPSYGARLYRNFGPRSITVMGARR